VYCASCVLSFVAKPSGVIVEARDKKLRYGSSIGQTAPILYPYRYGTVLLTVRSHTTCHTPLAIHRAVWDGMGAVWERYGNGMARDWSCGMGAVWDGWVGYMGAVWEQYWSCGMGSV